jgi:2-polyprenyl-3-methyl-5-hydroxy-6-metoxy-1,4-benzoquinol methylase
MMRPRAGLEALTRELLTGSGARPTSVRTATERLIAVGYGLTYDAVVSGFPPYERLLEEITTLIARSAPAGASASVLDVSCGTGTVAARIAGLGYRVTGVDAVGHLVNVAREHWAGRDLALTFEHRDIASDPPTGEGTFDVIVSMHTLYWHPRPDALLAACRRALKPGGHAIFLTYGRPARVRDTFGAIRARHGTVEALRALRWLLPTALFETLRHVDRRYLSEGDFRAAVTGAGFEILEVRETFLAGISRLAWTRLPPSSRG